MIRKRISIERISIERFSIEKDSKGRYSKEEDESLFRMKLLNVT